MNGYWRTPTPIGEARIIRRNARWHAEIGDEALGSYLTPEAALDDLVGGHTFRHSACPDTSRLGLPDALADWQFVPAAWQRA